MNPTSARRVRVQHDTVYRYAQPVELAHHSAHLRPRDTPRQRVLRWHCRIEPEPDGGAHALQQDLDVHGNWRLGFGHSRMHAQLSVHIDFDVELLAAPCPPAGVPAHTAADAPPLLLDYALASPCVPLDDEIAAFARAAWSSADTLGQALPALTAQVHRHMRYEPGTTDVSTDARQVLRLGRGVCQDYAHLMIAACRALGHPARYVSGYLIAPLPGAGATHAWVQVWDPGCGWVGWDPTHDLRVDAGHVVLAWGRDYTDVAPLRGVIRGGGLAPPQVSVQVSPLP